MRVVGEDWTLRECHEEVADAEGYAVPCERPALGWRIDPEDNQPYPVCATHYRWPYAEEWVAAEAALARVTALANKSCENYDKPGQDCITAGPEVLATEGCTSCLVRAALEGDV